jgi:hypothetical protein
VLGSGGDRPAERLRATVKLDAFSLFLLDALEQGPQVAVA